MKKMNVKRLVFFSLLVVFSLVLFALPASGAGTGGTWVITIKGNIDEAQTLFVQRAYAEAIAGGAQAIIFEIDTLGGYLIDAIAIKDVIYDSTVPTVCFVTKKAISAGSLLALAGDNTVMRKGTTIGAAEPRLGNEKADEKTVSYWAAELRTIAEARERRGDIAAAFADSDIVIPGYSKEGKILTLTDSEALDLGMSDATLDTIDDVIAKFELPAYVKTLTKNLQENIAGWLSNPIVAAILLMIGIAGILIEIFTAGSFGVFGTVGLISFALFFAGNIWAGNAGVGSVILFVVGLILLIVELFVTPGFGVAGVAGIAAVFAGIVWASPSVSYALTSLALGLAGSVVLVALSLRFKKTRRVWNRLILSVRQENESGYISADATLPSLMGQSGVALTPLRPAGSAKIAERRVDVVTEGDFIEAGAAISVIAVEGLRVVVKRTDG
ncbi:MAG: nodulation protein NfeD [Clostridiales bacterium]|nr:nodulation protein NfeD [Clostridiales bacterium]